MSAKSSADENDGSNSSPWSVIRDSDEDGNADSRHLESIAIIGMSCRLPGSAKDLSGFWEMLKSGRTAWTSCPGSRFNMKAFQDPSGVAAESTNVQGANFLRGDIRAFDASFFGLNPLEVAAMDPQHRLLLEMAYEAFENAGLSLESLWGSKTGVYVGQWTTDFHEIATRDISHPPKYLVTGTGPAISSNRISYFFNLRGPSFTVDTGCSSSLVALHQAIHSLRSGEASQCFVGGVNLLLDPQRFVYQSKLSMFSTEGRCYSFDTRANGYGRGEGCTGVVLKPLSLALRDGDSIRAIIRNSSVTQDGRTPGLTVPSAAAQTEAIVRAYGQISMVPQADYIEAHGTGTIVGDPIEAGAIAAAFKSRGRVNERLPMGSVKGNIGHTEAAAGLAGLIKAVLMLEKGMIPPQANYKVTNAKILLEDWNMRIPTKLEQRQLRRISVNSFGYGGTNAHVVVEKWTALPLQSLPIDHQLLPVAHEQAQRLFFLSAASERSCQALCKRLSEYLVINQHGGDKNLLLSRLAYTLERQSVLPYRMSVVASTIDDLLHKLIASETAPVSKYDKQDRLRIAYVFSGQGAQYAQMGSKLLDYPRFRKSMEKARQQISRLGSSWDLLEELNRPSGESRINEPSISQPSCTAIQLALVDLLAEMGISPSAVVGHSSGEIAAAYAVGAVSFDNAVAIAYFRGRVTSELLASGSHQPGAMLAVGADLTLVEEHIEKTASEHRGMRIACFNSPRSVTVSGDAAAIDALQASLDACGYFSRKLKTNGAAYHSHHMRPLEMPYTDALGSLPPNPPSPESSRRFFSTVHGKELGDLSQISTSYWTKNLLSPVLFTQAFSNMMKQTFDGEKLQVLIEIGPHSQMGGPVKQILKESLKDQNQTRYTSCLTRGKDAEVALLETLSRLRMQGLPVPLHQLNKYDAHHPPKLLVDLPPYPFDRERIFWHESRVSKNYRHRKYFPHELLGTMAPDVNHLEPRWRHFLCTKESPWLRNHVVQGQTVVPAAGYLTMVMQAMQQHAKTTDPTGGVESMIMRNVSFGKALLLSENAPNEEIGLSLRPQPRSARESSSLWSEFRIFSVSKEDKWTEHCRGLIQAVTGKNTAHDTTRAIRNMQEIDAECSRTVPASKFYNLSRQLGLDWQSPFDSLTTIRTGPRGAVATACAKMGPATGGTGDILHPSMLDAALFHGYFAFLLLENKIGTPVVPTFIQEIRVANKPVACGQRLVSTSVRSHEDRYAYNIVIQDCDNPGDCLIEARGVDLTKLPAEVTRHSDDACFKVDWVPYVDAWKSESREGFCEDPESPTLSESSRYLDAVAIHYVQQALSTLESAEIRGAYKHLLPSLQTWTKNPAFPPSSLPKKPNVLDASSLEDMLLKIGPHLADILSENMDLWQVINPDDLSQAYNSNESRGLIGEIAEYCHALGKQTPRLKALMVGAGAAVAAGPITQALHGRDGRYLCRFDIAGISPSQFEDIQQEFGVLANALERRSMDVAGNVEQQGFEASSYDLIIAAYASHDAHSIDSVLSNFKLLLKPGAKLILLAVTSETLHYDLLLGLFAGRSLKQETGYDPIRLSPVLPRQLWSAKLKELGLESPDFSFGNKAQAEQGTLSAFMAAAPWASAPVTVPPMHFVTTDCSRAERAAIDQHLDPLKAALPEAHAAVHCLTAPSPGENMVVVLPEVARQLCLQPDESCWLGFRNWLLKARAVLMVSSNSAVKGHDNAHRAVWTGLARSIRHEFPHIRFVTMDFEAGDVFTRLAEHLPGLLERTPVFDLTRPAYEAENEFVEVDRRLHVSRVRRSSKASDYIRGMHQLSPPMPTPFLNRRRTLTAELGTPGLLETIRWKDDPEASIVGDDEVRLELRAASINFKDVLIAAGQLPGISSMRNDCSGVVVEVGANMRHRFSPGDRVLALYSRSYTNYPVVHGDCCQPAPQNLSFDEAASVPIVWATVYYSLVDMGRLKRGDRMLVHSAAGAVGQAAIIMAQYIGAEIFATVGSQAKREVLHDKFGIPHDHIFSSRSTAFYGGIKDMTNDYGVDVVLNSLSGEVFRQSCNLVAPFGRFIEIGRKDLMDDALMPMSFLLKNITFSYVDMALIIDVNKPLARRVLHDVVALLAKGHIRPVMITSMPISDIEPAFRLIQGGKHTGKIILRVEDQQEVQALPPAPSVPKFKSDATYAVVGGFGGIGQAAIQWMADHGAKHIVSITRSGAKSQTAMDFVEQMKARGIDLMVAKCDVASPTDVAALARRFNEEPGLCPIKGVIQSSVVIEDGLFEQMSAERWWNVLGPKVQGTKNLDGCFRDGVDFFVVMSSVVSICGNGGQANYAAACCFQDELVRQRVASGLHGYSMNIGPVREVGWLSERPEVAKEIQRRGFGAVSIAQVLSMLSYGILHEPDTSDINSSVCAISPLPYSEDSAEQGERRERRFAHVVRTGDGSRAARHVAADDPLAELDRTTTFDAAVDIVCAALLGQLGKLISTPAELLSAANSLDHYGVDSLIAVEMRNWIVAHLHADLPLMTIRGTGSIRELAMLVADGSPLVGSC